MFRSFASAFVGAPSASAKFLLVVCVLVCGASTAAEAQDADRTIAIVNLSSAPTAAASATRARDIVVKTPGLRATVAGDLAQTLEGPLPSGGPDEPVLARASSALEESEHAFGEFKSRLATSKLLEARRELFSLAPTAQTTALLADVSFRMALIHLRAENMGLAIGEFQLLHRLDPERTVDSFRYPPSIVKAFESARKRVPTAIAATLQISATYNGDTIYVDGKAVGQAPLILPITAGTHIVAIAAPKYQATARAIDVDAGDVLDIKLDLQPRSPITRARELRFQALQQGLSEESLRVAAARVSRLVGSDAVLIIVGDASQATLYIPELDKLSYQSEVDPQLARMLALTLPVPRPTLLDGVLTPPPELPWYRNPVAIAAAGATTAMAAFLIFGGASIGSDGAAPTRLGDSIWDF
tara:strand:+ start:55403 stop:56644 length:1242 start_codon:yes stop_codon:yes gene_type:complete